MSEVETHVGKLIPISLDGLSIDEWVQKELGQTEKPDYETWLSHYDEEQYSNPKKYPRRLFYDGVTLFEVVAKKLPFNDFVEANENPDGSIDFVISYYNGGASLDEVLAEVVEKVK